MSHNDYGYHSDAWDDGGYDEYYDDGYADDGNDLDDYYEADPHSDTGAAEEYSKDVQEEISDGYRHDEPTSGAEGGGNAQKTNSKVDLQNLLVEFRICTDLLQGGYYGGHSSQDQKWSVSDLM